MTKNNSTNPTNPTNPEIDLQALYRSLPKAERLKFAARQLSLRALTLSQLKGQVIGLSLIPPRFRQDALDELVGYESLADVLEARRPDLGREFAVDIAKFTIQTMHDKIFEYPNPTKQEFDTLMDDVIRVMANAGYDTVTTT